MGLASSIGTKRSVNKPTNERFASSMRVTLYRDCIQSVGTRDRWVTLYPTRNRVILLNQLDSLERRSRTNYAVSEPTAGLDTRAFGYSPDGLCYEVSRDRLLRN